MVSYIATGKGDWHHSYACIDEDAALETTEKAYLDPDRVSDIIVTDSIVVRNGITSRGAAYHNLIR